MKSIKIQNEIDIPKAPIVHVAIVIGSRNDLEAIQQGPVITVRRKHFTPRYGWELKDIVIVGLPQRFRFMVLHDMEVKETAQAGFFILFCRKG